MKKTLTENEDRRMNYSSESGLVFFVLFLPFIIPESLYHVPQIELSSILLIPKVVSALAVIVLFVRNGRFDKWTALLLLYCFIPVLSTIINSASVSECFKSIMPIFVFSLLVAAAINSKAVIPFCKILSKYFFVVILINFLTVLCVPEGLYATYSDILNPYNWFLGFDNIHVLTFVLAGVSSLIVDYSRNGLSKLSFISRSILVLGTLTVFVRFSATSIVIMLIFDLAILLRKRLAKLKSLHFGAIAVILVVISVGLFTGLFLDLAINFANAFFGTGNKDQTVLDRFAIWQKTIDAINTQGAWVLGLGIQGSSATIAQISITHAHNQLLEEIYVGGIIELSLLVAMIFVIFKKLEDNRNNLSLILGATILAFMTRWLVESVNMDFQIMIFTIAFYIDKVSLQAELFLSGETASKKPVGPLGNGFASGHKPK